MKVTSDPEVDVLRMIFSNAAIEESDEDKPGVIIDSDAKGNVVGMEILEASARMENPRGGVRGKRCMGAWRSQPLLLSSPRRTENIAILEAANIL